MPIDSEAGGMTPLHKLVPPIREAVERREAARRLAEQKISARVERLLSEGWAPSEADCQRCLRLRGDAEPGTPGTIEIDIDGAPAHAPCPRNRPGCRLDAVQLEREAARRQQAAQAAMAREREWLASVGVGERYWDATREGLREPTVICEYLDAIEEQVAAGRGLVLLGGLGVGKSAALALIAREAYRHGPIPTWMTTVTRLIRHLLRGAEMVVKRDRFGVESTDDPKTRALLLLDEFGAAYESDYAMAAFEDYVGWRYDQKLATCVAGNLTPDDIRGNPHYARMVDRWRETCRVVVIPGRSRRQGLEEAP